MGVFSHAWCDWESGSRMERSRVLTRDDENVGEEGEVTGLLSGEHATIGGFGFRRRRKPKAINIISFHSREHKRKGWPKRNQVRHGCDSYIEIANKERCAWNRVRYHR